MKPDLLDTAQEQADAFLNEAIRAASEQKAKRLPESPGFCDYCGDATQSESHLFCSLTCSKADEHERKQRALNGR